MSLKHLILILLTLSGCSSMNEKKSEILRGSCYVEWESEDVKNRLFEGRSLMKSSNSDINSKVKFSEMSVFSVVDVEADHYIIHRHHNFLEAWQPNEDFESFRSMIKERLSLEEDDEKRLRDLFILANKRVNKSDLVKEIERRKMDKLSCEDLAGVYH